jgi:hypothetical protein
MISRIVSRRGSIHSCMNSYFFLDGSISNMMAGMRAAASSRCDCNASTSMLPLAWSSPSNGKTRHRLTCC